MAFLTFAAFAAMTANRPWWGGKDDCTVWVADWCIARWGIDPAATFRGRYETREQADAMIAEAGGLVSLITPFMTFAKIKEAADEGDVGVINVLGRDTAAIRVGDKWAFRTLAGIGFLSRTPIIVWGD